MEGNSSGSDENDDDESSASSSSSDHVRRHVKWYIGGTRVCRRAFLRMLGVGQGRLNRTRSRFKGLDERTLGGRVGSIVLV